MWTCWYTRRHKIGSPWFLKEHCLTTKLWAVMCVAQTQLSQCCCLPDEPLNHPQLLKYHGNFCKCRNAQCNPVARFQLTKLHPPCSFTFLPPDAPLPSNSAHQAPAMPRTLWALQSQALPDHRQPLQPFAGIIYTPFPFVGAWAQWAQEPIKNEPFQRMEALLCTFPKVVLSPESMAWKQHTLAGLSLQQHVKQ